MPAILVTFHRTIIHFCSETNTMRHSFAERLSSPASIRIFSRNDMSMETKMIKFFGDVTGPDQFDELQLLEIEPHIFAMSDGNKFLCAEQDGRLTLSRDKVLEWEKFYLFEVEDCILLNEAISLYSACIEIFRLSAQNRFEEAIALSKMELYKNNNCKNRTVVLDIIVYHFTSLLARNQRWSEFEQFMYGFF